MLGLGTRYVCEDVMIIGFNGLPRSGKDTCCDILVADYGYEKLSFSQPLMVMLDTINPKISGTGFLRDATAALGYEKAKDLIPEYRRLLQNVAQSCREVIDEDVWLDLLYRQIQPHKSYCISNVRYRNEYWRTRNYPHDLGGIVVHVMSPNEVPASDHISDHDLEGLDFDAEICNDGTIDDLRVKVRDIVERFT